jgi:hypothetical protein
VPAILHCSKDDVVSLTVVDKNGIEQQQVFSSDVKAIQSATMMSTLLTFEVANKK